MTDRITVNRHVENQGRAIDRLHGILVFLRVVETGSLSATARALGVSTSAVSAALARLERKLAVRLLDRTTRRLSPTAEGAEFYARCKQITADLEEAEMIVGRAGRVPSGRLRVGMPSALSAMWIVPRLPEFTRAYPSVALEIVCTDFVPSTIAEGVDVSVQVGELHASSLSVRRLASVKYVVCAAPAYLAARGVPATPGDLRSHTCLAYRRPRNGRIRDWRFGEGDSVDHITLGGAMTFNSGEALVAAAAAGLGVIQVAEYYAWPLIESGRLVELLDGYKTEWHDISVVFPQQRRVAPKLRVFVDFLVALFDPPPWKRTTAVKPRKAAAVRSVERITSRVV
jgi:LysR family transcriptional regulator for bpeEF and oprC